MKRHAFITLLAAAVLLGGSIGGAFAGGMVIGRNQGKAAAAQEAQSRIGQATPRARQGGLQQGTPLPGGTPRSTASPNSGGTGSFGGLAGGGATIGAVEKVEGNVITLTTRGGAIQILVTGSTSIQKMGEGSLSDIAPGANITVSGTRKSDGSIEATNISITPIVRAQ